MAVNQVSQAQVAQNTQNLAQTQASQPNAVDQAVDNIEDRLTTSWTDWAVTHGDVKNIAKTLEGLNADQTQQVIEKLDQNGTLDKMAREMTDGKVAGLGGLSASEKTDFFKDMAQKLDGKGLATLSDSFAQNNSRTGGLKDVEGLGQAVATHSSTQTKVDYVSKQAAKTTDNPSFNTKHLQGASTHLGDAEAHAVGHVLRSLGDSPSAAEQAFGSLNDEQLGAVLDASINKTTNYTAHAVTASFDAKNAGQILDSASKIGDADIKARVFDAGAQALGHLDDYRGSSVVSIGLSDSMDTVTGGLTQIVDSDTTGVMRELAYNQQTFGGTSFATYAKSMLNTDQAGTLGDQMAKLQLGNALNENPVDRFEASVTLANGEQRHENAGALGHFVAGVYEGAEAISKDVKQQQELTTAVLKSTLTLVDKAKINPGVSVAAGVAKDWVSIAVKAAIQDPGSSAAEQLERAAIPMDPSTQEIGVGDKSLSAFNDRITQVQRLANP